MLYSFVKPLLFAMDPETAHNLTLKFAKLGPILGQISGTRENERMKTEVGSVQWSFPVGLAAGLDKNAEALDFFSHQGFGALECGTVTLKPQDGNPRPRMFRYPEQESLRNSMGFPNAGLEAITGNIRNYHKKIPLGVNMGKNKDTSLENSIYELVTIQKKLSQVADYFVINVSSPNTPGLRALQERSYLSELFTELNKSRVKDLYLKIAPDLAPEKIIELVKLSEEFKLTGMIATNTTIIPEMGAGGISGKLLTKKSRSIRELILNEKSEIELISVGGISSPEDLFDLWKNGGKACQVYTSYVYQGPELLKDLHFATECFLNQNGMRCLKELFELSVSQRQNLNWKISPRTESL